MDTDKTGSGDGRLQTAGICVGSPSGASQQWYSRSARGRLPRQANLLRGMGATQVFIFGSAAKGRLRPDSDIDMAVTGLPPQVYFSAVSKASNLLGRPVDLVDLDDPTPLTGYLLSGGELVRIE